MLSMVRIVGASFPFASSIVQLQSELTDSQIQARLRRIDDPISHLHPDVRDLSEKLYAALRLTGRFPLNFPSEFYASYRRPLAMLEAQLFIAGNHALGGARFVGGIWPNGPHYVLYMCGLFEDPARMSALVERVDTATPGSWLNGESTASDLDLPVPVVRAVFEAFADRGLGSLSKTVGETKYLARA